MQLELRLSATEPAIRVEFRRHRWARRYILRVTNDGIVRVTIPRGGSQAEAARFAEKNREWIENQRLQRRTQTKIPTTWSPGTKIWFRGAEFSLEIRDDTILFADQRLAIRPAADFRPTIERHLWQLARTELTARAFELAAQLAVTIQRVTVRNQRTRWGSCSRRGTVSLNWRLIQTPPAVRDYVIVHELMHRREMNHSRKFWQHVTAVCPHWRESRLWLRAHRTLLHSV